MSFGGVSNRCATKLDDSLSGREELISELDKRLPDENSSENGYRFMEMEVLEQILLQTQEEMDTMAIIPTGQMRISRVKSLHNSSILHDP